MTDHDMTVWTPRFGVGDPVAKRSGYGFPGVVVAVFHTTANRLRYVVECVAPDCEGMPHIYNEDQLEARR